MMKSLNVCISIPNVLIDSKKFENSSYKAKNNYSDKEVKDFPEAVTFGFRQTLYSVFDNIIVPKNQPENLTIFNFEVELINIQILITASKMHIQDKNETLISMTLNVCHDFIEYLNNHSSGNELGLPFIESLSDTDFGTELILKTNDLFKNTNIGVKSDKGNLKSLILKFSSPAKDEQFHIGINWLEHPLETVNELSNTKTTIFALYYFGWLLFQRIIRYQTEISLTPRNTREKEDYIKLIIKVRISLLNIERFILTKNRTKNSTIKLFCDDIVKNFNLEMRHESLKKLHESFERHLDNYTSIEQVINAEKTNRFLLLLSGASISLAIFDASFVSVSKSALVFNFEKLFETPIIWAFAFALIVGIVILSMPSFKKIKIHDKK